MNYIWKIDDWIMAKHQWVADRVYTRFDLSPYEIAAHCFGAVVLAALIQTGIWFQELRPVQLAGCIAGIAVSSMWFWLAIIKHNRWKKDSKSAAPSPVDALFRIVFFMPSLVLGLIGLGVELSQQAETKEIIASIRLSIFSVAFYFYGCNAPTFIERKEHKLVEVRA